MPQKISPEDIKRFKTALSKLGKLDSKGQLWMYKTAVAVLDAAKDAYNNSPPERQADLYGAWAEAWKDFCAVEESLWTSPHDEVKSASRATMHEEVIQIAKALVGTQNTVSRRLIKFHPEHSPSSLHKILSTIRDSGLVPLNSEMKTAVEEYFVSSDLAIKEDGTGRLSLSENGQRILKFMDIVTKKENAPALVHTPPKQQTPDKPQPQWGPFDLRSYPD